MRKKTYAILEKLKSIKYMKSKMKLPKLDSNISQTQSISLSTILKNFMSKKNFLKEKSNEVKW